MFQREVAERIVAPPGSKTYGRLSVLARLAHARRRSCSTSQPSAFVPPPKVTSSRGAVRAARRAAALRPRDCSSASPRRRSASAARCCARACKSLGADPLPLLARPASSRPRAPRKFRSRVSSRSRDALRKPLRSARHDQAPPPVAHRLRSAAVRDHRRLPGAARHRGAGPHRPLRRLPFRPASCRTAISRSATARSSTCAPAARCRSRSAMRSPASSRRAGPDAATSKPGAKVAVYPWIGCGQCAACRPARRISAPQPRHLGISGRRRLCLPRAGAASALSDRLCAAVAVVRRRADVLGPDRLFGAQAARGARRARPGAAGRPRRRRHDGARASRARCSRMRRSSPTSTPASARPRSRPAPPRPSIRPIPRRARRC